MTVIPEHIDMDATDHQLIKLLRADARRPVSSLAKALGVSRGTVQNRIDRLHRSGVILGFTVRLKSDVEVMPIRAIALIEVHRNASDKVADALRRLPEIPAIHTTNGRWDLIAEIATSSLAQFDEVLRKIRQHEDISNSETSLMLSTIR